MQRIVRIEKWHLNGVAWEFQVDFRYRYGCWVAVKHNGGFITMKRYEHVPSGPQMITDAEPFLARLVKRRVAQ